MKEMVKRTAVVTLAGVMSVGMLSGCGSKDLDGTKTVATVDGTDIPLGVVSLYAREQQQQTTSMYLSYMGSAIRQQMKIPEKLMVIRQLPAA